MRAAGFIEVTGASGRKVYIRAEIITVYSPSVGSNAAQTDIQFFGGERSVRESVAEVAGKIAAAQR